MRKKRIQMRLQRQVDDLGEVGVVDMGKDTEHLLKDRLTTLVKGRRKSEFFARPVGTLWRLWGGDDLGGSWSWSWTSGEDGLVRETVVDPGEDVFDVLLGWEWTWGAVGAEPVIVGPAGGC